MDVFALYPEIDFRTPFRRLEGFPDFRKRIRIVDETGSRVTLIFWKQSKLGDGILALPGLQNLSLAGDRL